MNDGILFLLYLFIAVTFTAGGTYGLVDTWRKKVLFHKLVWKFDTFQRVSQTLYYPMVLGLAFMCWYGVVEILFRISGTPMP